MGHHWGHVLGFFPFLNILFLLSRKGEQQPNVIPVMLI